MTIEPIAYIRTDFPEKFGVPRQSGLAESLTGRIVFEPAYRNVEALRGLEGFSHLWLIWEFSANRKTAGEWQPTVRPPRLGGNRHMGVFATRSPFRPNPLGLSCVEFEAIDYNAADGPAIIVKGADLMDGTPIYDIKPYLPYVDSIPDAKGGFSDSHKDDKIEVLFDESIISEDNLKEEITEILSLDPKPQYQGEERVYGLSYKNFNIKFRYEDGKIKVLEIIGE
jgi:tRNA-Thr(GGU) m(6)t(6)A37 methyltransferase TsaA